MRLGCRLRLLAGTRNGIGAPGQLHPFLAFLRRRMTLLLQTLGCDEGQGYFFSRPVPPGETQPGRAPRLS